MEKLRRRSHNLILSDCDVSDVVLGFAAFSTCDSSDQHGAEVRFGRWGRVYGGVAVWIGGARVKARLAGSRKVGEKADVLRGDVVR